jgi:hypothetical protein
MNTAWTICSDRGKEIVTIETDESIFHLTTVSSEEHGSCARTITNAKNIAFFE